MPRVIISFIFSLFVISHSNGQYRYVEKFLRTDGRDFVQQPLSEPLGAVLASGYLSGKLKAYKFATADSVAKWGPKLFEAEAWKSGKYYYSGDMVEYKGKAYSALIDNNAEPINEFYWMQEVQRNPVSLTYYFPTLSDTLSKEDFLNRMVAEAPVFDEWIPDFVYFFGDFVMYKGIPYKSLSENKGKNPEKNPDDWHADYDGGIQFYSLRDLSITSILYHYTIINLDTTWYPMMLSVYKQGLDVPERVAHFYYQDAINYLNTLPLSVLNSAAYTPVANNVFAFDDTLRADYLKKLPEVLRLSKVKLTSKNILSLGIYSAWLGKADKNGNGQSQQNWQLLQRPSTLDLVISRVDSRDERSITPFLIIPGKTLDKLLSNEKVSGNKFVTYRELLRNPSVWWAPLAAHRVDSLKPFINDVLKNPVKSDKYFTDEKYFARLDSGNDVVLSFFKNAWPWLMKNFNAGKIKERFYKESYYEDKFNWSLNGPWTIRNNKLNLGRGFSLNGFVDWPTDSIYQHEKLMDVNIIYRKEFNLKDLAGQSFRPEFLQITYQYRHGDIRYVTLAWKEFKVLLTDSGLSDKELFIRTIESASLNFYDSELVYALMEDWSEKQ